MKSTRVINTNTISVPSHWEEMPWGRNYRYTLENKLKPWFIKMCGFHLLKIGNLSAEINIESCTISHQINVTLEGQSAQIKADPLHLPIKEKSVDVCLLAHILPWCCNPYRLLLEAYRVLIDDGWLILSSFNPLSLIGIVRLLPILRHKPPYNSYMFTITRQIGWLSLLNFEVLYHDVFQIFPWSRQCDKLLCLCLPSIGCMQLIVARKRTIPLTLNFAKYTKARTQHRLAMGAIMQYT